MNRCVLVADGIHSFPDQKWPFDEFPVEVDMTDWLFGETIAAVAYSARRLDTGEDATAVVLDALKHSNTTTHIYPWIKGGTSGITYQVFLQVTSSVGAKTQVALQFTVQ